MTVWTTECQFEEVTCLGIANGCYVLEDTGDEPDDETTYEAVPMKRVVRITLENKEEALAFLTLAWQVNQ